eukprot:162268-Alexandrium_andersonii.AAC.1
MSASLVGSEMCIRDRRQSGHHAVPGASTSGAHQAHPTCLLPQLQHPWACLLYTSDAADDM